MIIFLILQINDREYFGILENYTNQSQHQFSLKWFRKRIEKVEESNKKYQEKTKY